LVSDLTDFVCEIPVDVDGGGLLGWHDVETHRIKRRLREVTTGDRHGKEICGVVSAAV